MGQVDGNRMVVWHADFLRIIFANLCVCTSLYMFLPVVPACMGPVQLGGAAAAWLPFVAFAAGACLPAPFCNFWLDAYRRKSVALWALACLVAATALFLLDLPYYGKWLARMAQGASYGVFQIAVGSTLLLDLSDTRKRTEAAHVYYWFARLALVFGPLAGVMLPQYHGAEAFSAVAVGLQVCAFLLLSGLRVPFRAPLEPSLFTFDRFWLPRGFRLFVPLFGVCLVAGLLMGRHCGAGFCVFLGVGFWLALWLHRCVFRERLQRELACGFCSLVVAALLLSCPLADERWLWGVAVFLGCGLGWTTSRYLLSYIRICEHCERGTAQSSYMLGWDMGLLAGFSCSAGLWGGGAQACSTYIILGLCAATGLFHFLCVKPWYMQNKRK